MQKTVGSAPALRHSAAPSLLPISAKNLRVLRGGRSVLADVGIDISASAGTVVVLGPNGAGKSLLIRVLAGLVSADSGQLTWSGTAPDRSRMTHIGMVFQRPVHLQRTAIANIIFALTVTGTPAEDREAESRSALASAGLAHLADQPACQLSGGEQQRLALARAFACKPEILILDEPTASLDPASTAAIESMVRGFGKTGMPIILVTHDIGQARRLAGEIIFMHCGRILERGSAAQFFAGPRTAEAAGFIKGEIVL